MDRRLFLTSMTASAVMTSTAVTATPVIAPLNENEEWVMDLFVKTGKYLRLNYTDVVMFQPVLASLERRKLIAVYGDWPQHHGRIYVKYVDRPEQSWGATPVWLNGTWQERAAEERHYRQTDRGYSKRFTSIYERVTPT